MKKIMLLLSIMIIIVAACSSEKPPQTTDSGTTQSSDTKTEGTTSAPSTTGAATVDLKPITINCDNLVTLKTITDLTPSREVIKVEVTQNVTVSGKKTIKKTTETKVVEGPSDFANSKFETKTLTFDHKTVSEQSCEFTPTSGEKTVGINALNFRFTCGPKDQVTQKFNDEKANVKSIQEGSTGIASFWGIKSRRITYSLLSGKVDCYADVEGAGDLKIGEAIGKELEGKLS